MAGCRDYPELVKLLVQTSLLVGLHTVLVLEILSEDGRAVMRLSRGRSLHQKLTSTGDHRGKVETIFRSVMDEEAKDLPKILEIDALAMRDLGVADSTGTDPSQEAHGLLEEFLDGLSPVVKATDWLAAVNDVLMPLNMYIMRLSDLALASGVDNIRSVFKDITAKGSIGDVALYLASHLDAEVLSLELSRKQASSDHVKTADFCLELAQRSHGIMWPQLVSMLLKPREGADVLEVMYSQLQDASKGTIMLTWLPKAVRPYAEEKVKKVALSVVSESIAPKAAWMDEEYQEVMDTSNESDMNFIELYLKVLSLAHKKRLRSPPTLARFAISLLERHSELAYSRTTQSVVVPTVYQSSPYLYVTGVPSYFNYATVGTLLASSIADIFGPAVSFPPEAGNRGLNDVWWTPEAISEYNGTALCLHGLLERLGLQRQLNGSTELLRRELFLRAQGLRLAYDGLVASFGTAVGSRGFLKLWAEAQAAFFARFCLLSCDADQTPKPLSPRANCLLPLHNMPEFGAVFECVSREDFVAHQCLS
ncbi:hypothetical protein V5799_025780 [Amblyomma americanum]|uniref:Uncharacterized protein n=1 Tax=Amblyomma americanum TaxID=6943 RepID=A0AAQ4E8C2_AMBAM